MRFVSLTDLGRYDLYSSPARFLREDLHREITESPGHHVNRARALVMVTMSLWGGCFRFAVDGMEIQSKRLTAINGYVVRCCLRVIQ